MNSSARLRLAKLEHRKWPIAPYLSAFQFAFLRRILSKIHSPSFFYVEVDALVEENVHFLV